jgi:hypothetical protein
MEIQDAAVDDHICPFFDQVLLSGQPVISQADTRDQICVTDQETCL